MPKATLAPGEGLHHLSVSHNVTQEHKGALGAGTSYSAAESGAVGRAVNKTEEEKEGIRPRTEELLTHVSTPHALI